MMTSRTLAAVAAALILIVGKTPSQTTTTSPPGPSPEAATNPWSFTASAYTYLVPDSEDYVNPNFTADRGWLHLEARYNYEAQKAGSLWIGRNFQFGDKLAVELTPMVGGVFGDLNGIAPGYNFSLSYRKVELSSQSEYVFDAEGRSGNFFYTWSELTYSPVEWFRAGLVVQRTKAYQTDFDIQRGLLAGFSYKKFDFTAHVFNFGWTDPTVVLAVAVNF
jgi:hypothetical protein